MGSRSFCSLKQFINEEIHSAKATTVNGSIQTVINGEREVGYAQLSDHHLKELKLRNIPFIKVPRKDGLDYYIFYTDEKKALRLLDISKEHDGMLKDTNFDEAVEIGRLLGYRAQDIDEYVYRRYHQHYVPFKLVTVNDPNLDNLYDE